jgi:type I restriction enzyme R subunit
VVEVLILMAKAFLEAMTRDDTLGLNPYEITFYDALAENESAVHEFGDETLRRAAVRGHSTAEKVNHRRLAGA